MRFILNFFFFGIIFYLIWMFFPEAFKTLVSWANQVVAYATNVIENFSHKAAEPEPSLPPIKTTPAVLLFLSSGMSRYFKR